MKILRNIVIVVGLLAQCFSAAVAVDYICSSEIEISGEIHRKDISPDGKMLALFSDARELRFYSFQDSCWVENESLKVTGIRSYSLSPDWETLAVVQDRFLKLYTRDNDSWLQCLCVDDIKSYQFCPREHAIIVLTGNGELLRYNCLQNGSWAKDSSFLIDRIHSFEVFFNFFVVTTFDYNLIVYEYDYERLSQCLEINQFTDYSFSSDEQYFLLFNQLEDLLIIYKYEQEFSCFSPILTINNVIGYQFSPDERTIAILHENNELVLYEDVNGSWRQNLHTIKDVDQCIFSPDGKSFVVKINPLASQKPLMILYANSNGDWISDLEIGGLSGQVFFYNNHEFGVYQPNKKIALISKQEELWCKALEFDNVLRYLPPKELLFACSTDDDRLCLFEKRDGKFVEPFIIDIQNIKSINFIHGKSGKDLMVITHPDEHGISRLITFTQRVSCKSSRVISPVDFQEQDLDAIETVETVFGNLNKRDLTMRTTDTKTKGQKPPRKRRCLETGIFKK